MDFGKESLKMFNTEEKIKDFKVKYRNKCFALVDWKNLKMKDFSLNEMLECICNAANGSIQEMVNIVDHLTAKKKVFGRTQVYNQEDLGNIDIRRNENGVLELKGYKPNEALPLKGQHISRNPKIFRQDGQINKNFQRSEDKMLDFGQKVRELYPNEDNHFLTFAMQAIKKYAENKKIHTDKVIKGLTKGRYKLDTDLWKIVPIFKESKNHIIVINESDLQRLTNVMKMTEHKFNVNIKNFISQLLQDPVNTKVPYIFGQRGYTRSMLLNYLLSGKDPILIRKQRISDTDENGNPKTATMKVSFECPVFKRSEGGDKPDYMCAKKNFDRKLKKLFIKMFEKNLPQRKLENVDVDEATACGASSGAFVTKIGDVQRRQMPVEIKESSTMFNVNK